MLSLKPFSATFLPHTRGGVSQGDIMPKKEGPPPSCLGVLDHLHFIEDSEMRPYRLLKSERRRIIAACTSPSCTFRLEAIGYEGEYRIDYLSPHVCPIGVAPPRTKRKPTSHNPREAQQAIMAVPLVKCPGRGSSCSVKGIQAMVKKSGVDVGERQIRHLRQNSSCKEAELLQKLQILPAALKHIQGQLPAALAVLHTSELSPQFCGPAQRAFEEVAAISGSACSFVLADEKSTQSLFFGEADLVQHIEATIGHQIYTADAAHMHKSSVDYDCIVMLITRRLGNGKIIVPAWALTVLTESELAWTQFFNFCCRLGMRLNSPESVMISDMGKGLIAACKNFKMMHRQCLTHIFHRLQNVYHVFEKGNNFSIGAFFAFAKSATGDEETYTYSILRQHHLKADKEADFNTYWREHCSQCSAISALSENINLLDHFTSNNSESQN